jgi:L-threonylcarbamoyladenylate synthase
MPDNAQDAAHELFDTLRLWDAQGMQAICVEAPPDGADWDGVRDRLQRAAAPR